MTSPLLWPLLGMLLLGTPNDHLRKLYQRGYKAFAAKDYKSAKGAFTKLLPLLEQTQKSQRKAGTRGWHMMTFGQFDVLFHLASIAELEQQPRRACHYFSQATQRVKTIPSTWTTWKVSPNIPVRLLKAQRKLAQGCQKIPSLLKVMGLPPNTTLFRQHKPKTWTALKGSTLSVLEKVVTLKFEAPGYLSKIMPKVSVKRWQRNTLKVKLTKKPTPPKVVAVPRRLPPPKRLLPAPVPLSRKWWFWTVVGVGVVSVGVVTVVAVVNSNQPDQLAGAGNTAITLWQPGTP